MFSTEPITGANLPDGHLVLTYDDGPGPNMLAIAEYLSGALRRLGAERS